MNHATSSFLVLAGLAGTWYLACGRGHFATIRAERAAMAAAYERFERAEAATGESALLEEAAAELDRWRDELGGGAGSDEVPLLLAAAADAKACGLFVERTEAMAPDGGLGRNQRVRLAVSGTFAELFLGITTLENGRLPTRVTELSVQTAADEARVKGELVVVRRWPEVR